MHERIYDNICEIIGGTPIVRLKRIPKDHWAEMLVKLELLNPGGSVKDRIALSMIEVAERDGHLKPGGTIVEPTSGNTGIGLAMVGGTRWFLASARHRRRFRSGSLESRRHRPDLDR